MRSWAKPLSRVRLHVQLQLHVCLHGAIAATIACLFTRCDRRGDRSRDRSPRRSPRVNTVLLYTVLFFEERLIIPSALRYKYRSKYLLWGRLQEERRGIESLNFFTLWLTAFLPLNCSENIKWKIGNIHKSRRSAGFRRRTIHPTAKAWYQVWRNMCLYFDLQVKQVFRLLFCHDWRDTIPTSTWLKYHQSQISGTSAENAWEVVQKNDASLICLEVLYQCLAWHRFKHPRTLIVAVCKGCCRPNL